MESINSSVIDWAEMTSVFPTTDGTNMTEETNGTSFNYAGAAYLLKIGKWYKNYHGYFAVAVCIFGVVANLVNIVVLTRKSMVSATNCILTAMAVSDGLTIVVYLPFALRFYCLYGTDPSEVRNALPAIRFMLFFACFSVVVHSISIWLTVTLAIFRYIFIKFPARGKEVCSLKRAKIAVFLVYLITLIVCIPNFVTITIRGHNTGADGNKEATIWVVRFKDGTDLDRTVSNFNFWIQAVVVKLVPCIGLTLLSGLLIKAMQDAEKRREKLKGGKHRDDNGKPDNRTHRTTRMLLTVVILFLVTEFPQGIISLLSGILDNSFVAEIYSPLGDLMDIFALLNNGINFILYCTMSKQFRDMFIAIFVPTSICKRDRFTLIATNQQTPRSHD